MTPRLLSTRLLLTMIASISWTLAQAPQTPPANPLPPLFKGGPLKDNDPNARSVEGAVKDDNDNFIDGAVVKLKDMKTMQVRSFITKADGKYRFTGLRKDIDYELRADFQGRSATPKTVSVFDARKLVILNLKLAEKTAPDGDPDGSAAAPAKPDAPKEPGKP